MAKFCSALVLNNSVSRPITAPIDASRLFSSTLQTVKAAILLLQPEMEGLQNSALVLVGSMARLLPVAEMAKKKKKKLEEECIYC